MLDLDKLFLAGNVLISFFQRYPQRITAVVAASLLMVGGGAFAVASMAPDPADLPIHNILEAVKPQTLSSQALLLEGVRFPLFRTEVTRSNDSAETLLKRLGIDDPKAAAFMRNDALVHNSVWGRVGRQVSAESTEEKQLSKLTVRWVPDESGSFNRLIVERVGHEFQSKLETPKLQSTVRMASGSIQTSLFAATDEARIPDSIAIQLAEIFSGDIDFHRALRKGDRFSVVYESLQADGEQVRTGKVISAEFVNNGRKLQALWFQEPGASKGAYYTPAGESLRKAYLASPLEFSRVSSGFSMRFHPILQSWRAHLGVDYAAPTGTPVRSVADGTVEFAGVQGGFGNVVIVKHRNNHTTVYAHLSRIGVRKGQLVSQSQHIGAVGATGWATGPHLHFEFRVNGHHQDPLTLARQSDSIPVSAASRPHFEKLAKLSKLELQSASSMQVAGMQ